MTKQSNYAFIDSQNLNLAIRELGWSLDFTKFRIFLQHKYRVTKAFLFIGYIQENEALYQSLRNAGYILIFKPTVVTKQGVVKGNCDAELVLHTMIEYDHFDKAVIVSGDGDFYCLVDYLKKNKKLLKVGIPSRKNYSALLRPFHDDFFYIEGLRTKLAYKKR